MPYKSQLERVLESGSYYGPLAREEKLNKLEFVLVYGLGGGLALIVVPTLAGLLIGLLIGLLEKKKNEALEMCGMLGFVVGMACLLFGWATWASNDPLRYDLSENQPRISYKLYQNQRLPLTELQTLDADISEFNQALAHAQEYKRNPFFTPLFSDQKYDILTMKPFPRITALTDLQSADKSIRWNLQ